MKCLYIKRISGETYQMKCLYIKRICGETYQMKCLYIKQTYITLDNTPNKISKNIFIFLAAIRNTLKKKPINSSLKTPPQVNKKGKQLFTQFNNRLT